MLSCDEIMAERAAGNLDITPFDIRRLNPNSYNLTVADEVLVWSPASPYEFDVREPSPPPCARIDLREFPGGYLLLPGYFYVGSTREYTMTTKKLIPCIQGRSGHARRSLSVHCTAGFGDCGFSGNFVTEMFVIRPLRLYAGTEICQIYWHRPAVESSMDYADRGKYHNQIGATPAKAEARGGSESTPLQRGMAVEELLPDGTTRIVVVDAKGRLVVESSPGCWTTPVDGDGEFVYPVIRSLVHGKLDSRFVDKRWKDVIDSPAFLGAS